MRWKFFNNDTASYFFATISLLMLSGELRADYLYSYTGQSFSVTSSTIMRDGDDWITVSNTFQSTITAAIRTSSLLSTSTGLADITSITMTGTPYEGGVWTLDYPGNPISDPLSSISLTIGGYFNITSLDAQGLPSAWNIIVDQYLFVGGRAHYIQMGTSNLSDTINGYDEPFSAFSGLNQNSPGSWQVAWISNVPENQTRGLILSGLAIMGVIVRHRNFRSLISRDDVNLMCPKTGRFSPLVSNS